MIFDIERFRDERLAIQRSELMLDPPDGPLMYTVRARSSFRVFPEWTSRNRREVSERLVSLSEALKGLADENGGFQAIEIYATPAGSPAHPPELVSFYKYSLFQESWVHLSGLDFAMEPTNAQLMNEQLRKFERQFVEASPKAERPDANARSGGKADDSKDDKKKDTKTNANKAPKPGEKPSSKDADDDEEDEPEDEPEDEEEPDNAPSEPDEDEPANDGTAGDQGDEEPETDGSSTKSPPPKAGAQTMGPKSPPNGGVAPPPKGKALKMPKKKGVMGMDPDKDGFAKHGQRITLPSTVMGASRQINMWRSKYLA